MATISEAQVASTVAAIAAALPQRPNNPQGTSEVVNSSPQIKPEHVPETDTSSERDRAMLPPAPHASNPRILLNGPSPQKGSGQDRFRQLMSGQAAAVVVGNNYPQGPPTVYPQLPGLTPAAAYYQSPSNGTDGRAASVIPSPHFFTDTAGYSKGNGTSRGASMPAPYDSNAGSRNGVFRTTYTSILSSECQSRHFNPQFTEWEGANGKFYASVKLKDHTISDSRAYANPSDAKQSLAKQAVSWVRTNMRRGGGIATRAASIAGEKQAQMNRERADREWHKGGNGGNGLANGYGSSNHNYNLSSPNQQAVADKKSDCQQLLERVRSLFGHSRGPSEAVLADPAASRAFLEGFALGDKLRESAVRDGRGRSRSPKAGGDRRFGRDYRERSAVARHDPKEY